MKVRMATRSQTRTNLTKRNPLSLAKKLFCYFGDGKGAVTVLLKRSFVQRTKNRWFVAYYCVNGCHGCGAGGDRGAKLSGLFEGSVETFTYAHNTNELKGCSSEAQCIVKMGRFVEGIGGGGGSRMHCRERRMFHRGLWSRSFSPEWFYFDDCSFSMRFAGEEAFQL